MLVLPRLLRSRSKRTPTEVKGLAEARAILPMALASAMRAVATVTVAESAGVISVAAGAV